VRKLNVELEPSQEELDLSALEIRTVKSGLRGIASRGDDADERQEAVLGFLQAKAKEYEKSHFDSNRRAVETLRQLILTGQVTGSDVLERVRLSEKETTPESGLKSFFKGILGR